MNKIRDNKYNTNEAHSNLLKTIVDNAKSRGIDLRANLYDDIITLHSIIVPENKRGEGIGSSVMENLIELADVNGLIISLTPSKDFGGTLSKLNKFYKRFGFVPNSGSNKDYRTKESMIRHPKNKSLNENIMNNKYKNFLSQVRTEDNKALIDSISLAYKIIFENVRGNI